MKRILAVCTVTVIAISCLVWSTTGVAQQRGSTLLAFPSDYRTWTHTHTNIIDDPKDPFYGYHNVYVNPAGAQASMNKAATYPEGTKFVVAFYAVQKNGSLITQGNLLSTALMVKNRAQFASTGGWGYALFGPDNVAKPIDAAKDCHACHEPKKATDFVFSSFVK